ALQLPARGGFEVEREHGVAGDLREPEGAGLRHLGGPAGPVDAERDAPGPHLPHELHQRPARATRRGAARGAEAELLDNPRDPLAVEVLARDDDDAAVLEV